MLAGLGGPLLGIGGRLFVPVVIGEILAGILVGPAVLDAVDPANATISFLGEIGFAMLMLTVGMHLPLRDKRLAASLRSGALLTGIVCALAVPAGLLAARIAGTGHAEIYVVLLASGSAAVLLPALQETGIAGPEVMTVMAQVTIADLITILSVPAPFIFAPMAQRKLARSTTSGSRAAFSSMVSPEASVAAIIKFSVPVTVTVSSTSRVPLSRCARALI